MDFNMMLAGRILFGVGCESMYVGQSAIVSNWFINYELPLAISMISCIPLCGSFLNGAIVPRVYQNTDSFGDAFRVGFILCIVGFVLVLILYILDSRSEKFDAKLLVEFKKEKVKKEKEWAEENDKKVSFDEDKSVIAK